jgi:hypothetical protein
MVHMAYTVSHQLNHSMLRSTGSDDAAGSGAHNDAGEHLGPLGLHKFHEMIFDGISTISGI